MFLKKKNEQKTYDHATLKPVLKSSICNGEQVAGFQNRNTGAIEEVMLIKTPADLEEFKRQYGITEEVEKVY